MKNTIVILLAFCMMLIINTSCNKKNSDEINISTIENQAAIKFENDVLAFHTLTAGERVTGSFKFKNVGDHDLVISDVSSSCGCTVADYPRNAIKPGEVGMISVTYDSEGSKGMRIQKQITVLSNTDPARTVLKVVANVQ